MEDLKVLVQRFADNGDTTLSLIFINGIFNCFGVEDQEQKGSKVMHETRIPEGTYDLGLRPAGRFHEKYKVKDAYKDFHKGMLCVSNKPDWVIENNDKRFQYILIHTGNTDDHTSGCLLTNSAVDCRNFRGSGSVDSYVDFYPEIAEHLSKGGKAKITYEDIETGK